MTVLIVTHSEDNDSIGRVQEALAADGVGSFRFDTDRYPTDVRLNAGYGPGGATGAIEDGASRVALRDVSAVWYRRLRAGHGIPEDMDPKVREPSVGETRASVLGALSGLTLGGIALATLGAVLPTGPLAGGAAVVTAVGWALGHRHRRGWCTAVGCAHPLEPSDQVCPGCGAEVVETIARAEDRLAAEERVRALRAAAEQPEG